jgi:hypothetical protein
MLFAMPKVMFKMVAFVLERIVILVLNLPTSAPRLNNLGHVVITQGIAGDKGVVENHMKVRMATRCVSSRQDSGFELN